MKSKILLISIFSLTVVTGLGLLMSCDEEKAVNTSPTACLQITSFQQSGNLKSVNAGGSYTFTRDIKNDGPSNAIDVTLGYYLSTDEKITTSDTPLNVEDKLDLPSGTNNVKNVDIKIPGSVALGTKYYIGAIITSSSCTNNCPNYKSIELIITNVPETDTECLSIEKWQISSHPNNHITGGKSETFIGEIKNNSTATCSDVLIKFYLSTDNSINPGEDIYLDYFNDTLNIKAGSTAAFNVSLLIPPDILVDNNTYYIGMQIENTSCEGTCPSTAVYPVVTAVTNSCLSIEKWQISTHPNNVIGDSDLINYVAFDAEIKNTSGVECSEIWIKFYLSTDDIINKEQDTDLGYYQDQLAIRAGGTSAFQTYLRMPMSIIKGNTYYVGMKIDYSTCKNTCSETAVYKIVVDSEINQLEIMRWDYEHYSQYPNIELYSGDIAKWTRKINNNGTTNCADIKINYYLSPQTYLAPDAVVVAEETINLAAGEINNHSVDLLIPSDVKPGRYSEYIKIMSSSCTISPGPSKLLSYTVADYYIPSDFTLFGQPQGLYVNVTCGQTYSFDKSFINPGWKDCDITVRYYISKDTAYSNDDIYLGVEETFSTTGHSTESGSVNLTIPSDLAPGKYYVGALVTSDCTNRPGWEYLCVNVSCP